MSGFSDHFSKNAAQYAAFRPTYPKELIEYVAAAAKRSLARTDAPAARAALERGLVWDAGCGSGQAAVPMAEHFQRVVATDASAQQIAHATRHPRVEYRVAREFDSGLEPGSVALVTVAQALHWFDVARFHDEVKRVLAPGGVIAEWCYGRVRLDDPELDKIVEWFHTERIGKYWPAERRHVDNGYVELEFPFESEGNDELSRDTRRAEGATPSPTRLTPGTRPSVSSERSPQTGSPQFMMKADLTLEEFLGYVATWSSTIRARIEERSDPLDDLRLGFGSNWKNASGPHKVTWPIEARFGATPARLGPAGLAHRPSTNRMSNE
jgi:SAM-dependent methyltransferase